MAPRIVSYVQDSFYVLLNGAKEGMCLFIEAFVATPGMNTCNNHNSEGNVLLLTLRQNSYDHRTLYENGMQRFCASYFLHPYHHHQEQVERTSLKEQRFYNPSYHELKE